jgi:hypothetical protein
VGDARGRLAAAASPRHASGGVGVTIPAETRTYIDAQSGTEVFVHHAAMRGLEPGTMYVYEVLHDGAVPIVGDFVTAPAGRAYW